MTDKKTIFITGTDTEVGKTLISTGLVAGLVEHGLKTVGMKPIASGSEVTKVGIRNDDAKKLIAASNVEMPYEVINPYCFLPPISPHFAAAESGQEISLESICHNADTLSDASDRLIIEGVGGWQAPLSDRHRVADLAKKLYDNFNNQPSLSVVLVVGLRLGCINHAILTAESIRASGLQLISVVASQIDPEYARLEETLTTLMSELNITEIDYVPFLASDTAPELSKYLTKTIRKLL